jgi:ferrochelatase
MSPHYSSISTGAYFEEVREAAKGRDVEIILVDSFHAQAAFIEAIVDKVRQALSALERESGEEAQIVFSAHSLPMEYLEKGDPYVEQLNETVAGIVKMIPDRTWHLAYQSRGHGTGTWLEPDIENKLEELTARGVRQVVVVPLSFTCDHIETLYDIDITVANKARALGLGFARAEALNTSKRFIEALAVAVRPHLV